MPLTKEVSIIGIVEVGTWTAVNGATPTNLDNTANVYTRTKLGRPAAQGATITPSMTTVKQRAGDTGGVLDSAVSEYGVQLQIKLASATLRNLSVMMGLPTSALTGDLSAATPTAEKLRVRGTEMGTQEYQLYIKTLGPAGPRYIYMPRCAIDALQALELNKNAHLEPGGTYELLENADGDLYWIVDSTV